MIKLNIQRFSSTNKTTHYELSQYVSSDLPTYLVDYNSDMSKIDTGINTAQTTADTASTAATNAQTAAETAQGTANTAVTNAATADTKATTANTNIGTLANLTTTVKTDLVSAINEVDSNTDSVASRTSTLETTVGKLDGTVLYQSVSGNTGNIVLSQAASDFEEIEVFIGGTDGGDEYIVRFSGNTPNVTFARFFTQGTQTYLYTTVYSISGVNMTLTGYSRGLITQQAYDSNFNSVFKVIGYNR